MNRLQVKKYFDEGSEAWLKSSYEGDGHTFPTALARVRRTLSILENQFPGGSAEIVDLGCGAGQLCLALAGMGHAVTGVDESETMLADGTRTLEAETREVAGRVRFLRKDILDNGLEGGAYDAVTSMGVIGYLPNDDLLFAEAGRLLRPGGLFIVSCRNRLFNMASISSHTVRETESGGAEGLISEIRGLFQPIPGPDVSNFVKSLAGVSSALASGEIATEESHEKAPEPPSTGSIRSRQHTPKALTQAAHARGFENEGYYGVHPHLLMAGLNWSLPPNVFNQLSSSLEVLGHLPASLIWSSVFIGVFRKTS